MRYLSYTDILALSPMLGLIESLQAAFRTGCCVPPRQVAAIPGAAGDRLFVSMPAFDEHGGGAVKLATVYPDNAHVGIPTIHSIIIVLSEQGVPVVLLDGTAVTLLRTGAASALASKYLSRPDSSQLLIVGTGALAPMMAMGHCAVRPIKRITVWGRRAERAAATANAIRALIPSGIELLSAQSLEEAVRTADIVSCATSATEPMLHGQWLQPGAFVDLVGSFSPSKREADDAVVSRSRIFVDTFAGALAEAGDLLDPLARGVITRGQIEGELADLVRGDNPGRRHSAEIIVFKSVGTALEDLAAAQMLVAISNPQS
jgi:ornithine cyclodeaminase